MIQKKTRRNPFKKKFSKLCRNFNKQFIFKVKSRRKIWRFMSKTMNDELISITNYKFQLITCKMCKKVKRSSLSTRTCYKCLLDLPMQNERSCFTWTSWANIA